MKKFLFQNLIKFSNKKEFIKLSSSNKKFYSATAATATTTTTTTTEKIRDLDIEVRKVLRKEVLEIIDAKDDKVFKKKT